MSKITFNYFKRCHEKQLSKNEDYRSGYEYAKNHPAFQNFCIGRLKEAVRVFVSLGLTGDQRAKGMAFALKEMLRSRLEAVS